LFNQFFYVPSIEMDHQIDIIGHPGNTMEVNCQSPYYQVIDFLVVKLFEKCLIIKFHVESVTAAGKPGCWEGNFEL